MNLKVFKYISVAFMCSFILLTCCSNGVNNFNQAMDNKKNASTNSFEKEVNQRKTFTRKGYAIDIPTNWEMTEINENQILFTGPKIGNASVGFYITRLVRGNKNYLMAAQKNKEQQAKNQHYTTVEEKDISQQGFDAFMRRSHWFAPDINMKLFVREIFTQSDQYVFILSGSIPNTPHLKELDAALVAILNSFQFR